MSRIRPRLVTAVALALALIAASLNLGACDSYQDYPAPATYTVTYQGQCYAGYMYDPHEADYLGVPGTCQRLIYPSYPPVVTTSANYLLWSYLLEYDGFYHSGFYYDQYLTPMSSRYHVTIINKTSYTNYTSSFDRTYSSQIKTNSAKATWSGGKRGSYSFPSSNQNARNKPITNGGGNYGTSNSRDRTGPISNGGSRPTAPKPPSGGKVGSRR
jgi:hypothetical protein